LSYSSNSGSKSKSSCGFIDKDASHLNPETFIFYIKKLKALNAKDKAEYHDFALKCLKDYKHLLLILHIILMLF
jgi:molybdopterin/thiamine biosynthesis adenylyltransferase